MLRTDFFPLFPIDLPYSPLKPPVSVSDEFFHRCLFEVINPTANKLSKLLTEVIETLFPTSGGQLFKLQFALGH